jgi:hypothetical protein
MEKLSEAETAKLAEVRNMLEARGLSSVGRKVGRMRVVVGCVSFSNGSCRRN